MSIDEAYDSENQQKFVYSNLSREAVSN